MHRTVYDDTWKWKSCGWSESASVCRCWVWEFDPSQMVHRPHQIKCVKIQWLLGTALLIEPDHCNHVTSVDWTNLFFFSCLECIPKRQQQQTTIKGCMETEWCTHNFCSGSATKPKIIMPLFTCFASCMLCLSCNTFEFSALRFVLMKKCSLLSIQCY